MVLGFVDFIWWNMYEYGKTDYKTDSKFTKEQNEIVRQVIVEIYRRNKKKYVR